VGHEARRRAQIHQEIARLVRGIHCLNMAGLVGRILASASCASKTRFGAFVASTIEALSGPRSVAMAVRLPIGLQGDWNRAIRAAQRVEHQSRYCRNPRLINLMGWTAI
jgi:hypothetical protein